MGDNVHLFQALTEDDPLHIILDELGPPGKQLSYSMNATICLSLTNRWDHSKGMAVLVWLACARLGRNTYSLYSTEYVSTSVAALLILLVLGGGGVGGGGGQGTLFLLFVLLLHSLEGIESSDLATAAI